MDAIYQNLVVETGENASRPLIHRNKESALTIDDLVREERYQPLADRLGRYKLAKNRAFKFARFLIEISGGWKSFGASIPAGSSVSEMIDLARLEHEPELVKIQRQLILAGELRKCGCRMEFHQHRETLDTRLTSAWLCGRDRICALCAIRRGAKLLRRYVQRALSLFASGDVSQAWLVTLTVLNGPDFLERFNHLTRAMQRLTDLRKKHISSPRRQRRVEANKALAATMAIEIKRGSRSGEWHPHTHQVWLTHEEPDKRRLAREWQEITGDSYRVDVRPFHFMASGQITETAVAKDFAEVFKYPLKLAEMDEEDVWHAFNAIPGRRLLRSWGLLRGIPEPENLLQDIDEDPMWERIVIELTEDRSVYV